MNNFLGVINEVFENIGGLFTTKVVKHKVKFRGKAGEVCQKCSELKPKPKIMTEAQAQKFMDEFLKTDIPFDYPTDCCFARARVMADEIEKRGYEAKKLWIRAKKGHFLKAHKRDSNNKLVPVKAPLFGMDRPVEWGFHVAPIVDVEKSDGTIVKKILDPSLSQKPVSVNEWRALSGVKSGQTIDKITSAEKGHPLALKGNFLTKKLQIILLIKLINN